MYGGRPAAGRLGVLLGGEVAAVVALHRLGAVRGFAIPRHDLLHWLRTTSADDVLLAGLRLAALVAAWWLLASTALYAAARLARLHRAAGAIGWATLPCARRWADGIAAATILAASTMGAARPAAAAPPPSGPVPPVVVDADHRDRPVPAAPPAGARTGRAADVPPSTAAPRPGDPRVPASPPPVTTAAPAPAPGAPAPPQAAPPAVSPAATYTIVAGDNLWSIAADHLAATSGKDPHELTAADIAPYWSRLVELNAPRLLSGNPNLVYPGEVVELPPGA